ncbi:C40 family peptidase [Pontibacter silvestris]|uniref:C40 family peptidase n=1 Tax=Pontibacter silvestris TaxID=2305183 RepID=A0ABW4WT52_9BACT|nr:NlpC/P60 family protein [Pontibacter silvestris]MCC9138751.1 NlpC/P60 family protein [Pontibacter silvestris]
MTKTIILSALAIISLTLSFFYEESLTQTQPAKPNAPAFTAITPYAINSGQDLAKSLELKALVKEPAIVKASVPEGFFSKKLGLQFNNIENKNLIETVSKWLGTPYRYGSASRKGTDCSGFVTSIYREVYGIDLSRSSRSMFQDVKRVKRKNLRTGDLIFFRRSPKEPIFHVGIYLKGNKFVHSATNGGVRVSSLNEAFYSKNFYAAGRVI